MAVALNEYRKGLSTFSQRSIPGLLTEHATRLTEIAPAAFLGAGHRVLGRFYCQAPGFMGGVRFCCAVVVIFLSLFLSLAFCCDVM